MWGEGQGSADPADTAAPITAVRADAGGGAGACRLAAPRVGGSDGRGAGIRSTSAPRRLIQPRYRVERRVPREAAFIVGFADTPVIYRSLLAVGAARLLRDGTAGEVIAVDQDTEEIVGRRSVLPVHAAGT